MAKPDIENSGMGYAIFLIAGNEYAINVKTLNSIINPQEDIALPHSLDIRKDSLRIGDKEISLINLYELYNVQFPAQSSDTRIIVVNIEEHTAGFYVEKVKEFISLDTKSSDLSEFISMADEPLIEWKMKYGDRYILLPDFDKILTAII